MSTNHHTPLPSGSVNSSAIINRIFSDLDAGINRQVAVEAAARVAGDNALDDRIDGIIAGSETSSTETVDARTAINYLLGSPPTTLAEALEFAAANIYNVLAYGADNSGATSSDAAISAAIDAANAAGGGTVLVPEGTYTVDTLTLKNNVILQGDGRGCTIIQKTASSPSSNALLDLSTTTTIENITIRDMTLRNERNNGGSVLRMVTSAQTIQNVLIEDCHIQILHDNAGQEGIVLGGTASGYGALIKNVQINRCVIEASDGAANPFLIRLNISDLVEATPGVDEAHLWITNNTLANGQYAFDCEKGHSQAVGPFVTFTGNHIYGQTQGGAMFYHLSGVRCTHNYIHDVTAPPRISAPSGGAGQDNGALWLDRHMDKAAICAFNVLRNITGNAIFAEDMHGGSISHNVIQNCLPHAVPYTHAEYTLGNTSPGGNGILLVGGNIGVTIEGNSIVGCANNGIFLCRDFGPHTNQLLASIAVIGNYFEDFGVNGIELDSEYRALTGTFKIIGNDFRLYSNATGACIMQTGAISPARAIISHNALTLATGITIPYFIDVDFPSIDWQIVNNDLRGSTGAVNIASLDGIFAGNYITGTLGTLGFTASGQAYGNYAMPNSSERLLHRGNLTVVGKMQLGATSATISGDAITATASVMYLTGETNPDELRTIDGGSDGDLLILQTAVSGEAITIKHHTGGDPTSIYCGADRQLNNRSDTITLVYRSALSKWVMLSFADNA